MKGFNFTTKEITSMHDYLVKTAYFDFDKNYLNLKLEEGLENLELFFREYLKQIISGVDYHFILNIMAEEPLSYEDVMSIFGVFGYVMAMKSTGVNDKGFLATPQKLAESIAIPNYTGTYICNHDYTIGTVQLTILEKDGASITWVN